MSQNAAPPIVHPYALGVVDLIGGSFRAIMNLPGLYLGLSALSIAINLPWVVGVLAVLRTLPLSPTSTSGTGDLPTWVVPVLVGSAVLLVPAVLLQLKVMAMLSLATEQQTLGREPRAAALFSATRGFLPRSIALLGVWFLAGLALGVVMGLVLAGAEGPADAALTIALVLLVSYPVFFFAAIRLLVAIPVLAIERRAPGAALTRTWRLTAGSFWVTLGRYVLLTAMTMAVSAVVSGVGLLAQTAFLGAGAGAGSGGAVLSLTGGLVVQGATLLVDAVMLPYTIIYTALIYVDLRRRADGVLAAPPAAVPDSPYGPAGSYTAAFTPRAQSGQG